MTCQDKKYIEEIVAAGNKLVVAQLASSTGGNISVRTDNGILVTATGTKLDSLTEKQIVLVDSKTGTPVNSEIRPSCEAIVHLKCYERNKDLNAIVHCHPVWTIGVVSGYGSIPCMFPEFVDDVETIGYVDFVLPSTPEMAEKVAESLQGNNVSIIRNHGVFAGGVTVAQALGRAIIVEDSAKAFAIASCVGQPVVLTEQQARQISKLDAVQYRRELSKTDGIV